MELDSRSLLTALPASFPFYHLGEVRAAAPGEAALQAIDLARACGVGFSLLGELRGLILVLFDSGLDLPTYTEIGNTLASRIATQLSSGMKQGIGVMISPPRSLTPSQIEKLMSESQPFIQKTYTHSHDGIEVPILVWALPEIQEEFGNA